MSYYYGEITYYDTEKTTLFFENLVSPALVGVEPGTPCWVDHLTYLCAIADGTLSVVSDLPETRLQRGMG